LVRDQGQIAIKFILDESDEPCIIQYVLPGGRMNFTHSELSSAYLMASEGVEFEGAVQELLDQFKSGVDNRLPTIEKTRTYEQFVQKQEIYSKKYKPVGVKVKPVLTDLPSEYRIVREIKGDPLKDLPTLPTHPPEFTPGERYGWEQWEYIQKKHDTGFLTEEEIKLIQWMFREHEMAFAWNEAQKGTFKSEYFPPVKMAVIPHVPWVVRNIPIPPGLRDQICQIITDKRAAGVYEPSNASYRSPYFVVLKKDGKSLRIVHSLEPLNRVTIQQSGVPPATEELASEFAGRSCVGTIDLFVGYDERLIDEKSRDMTTFQTPFGAMRLTKLPMGWTNSVPIFHDDVTEILRPEIPHLVRVYIDDVMAKGPQTRYELEDGTYEVIPENPNIRRFVWEHLQTMNRVLQRLKYSGATASGLKTMLCAEEGMVVGHLVSYEGRRPEPRRVEVIENWGPCKDLHDVNAFLGTVGTFRMFIKGYAEVVEPINKLKRKNVPFEWGPEQEKSQAKVKERIRNCPALKPINYESSNPVILAVDTSYIAVGFYIYQYGDDGKPYYSRFDSITLNEREARFSQPKRELYGLKLALQHSYYWIAGCRNLIVETDAKYIHGVLKNPTMMPNATINRWIEEVLMYHFDLEHVPGKSFAADGPSRRRRQPGDPVRLSYIEKDLEERGTMKISFPYGKDDVLELEQFREDIDNRGGFYMSVSNLAVGMEDVRMECELAMQESEGLRTWIIKNYIPTMEAKTASQFVQEMASLLPQKDDLTQAEEIQPYLEKNRKPSAVHLEARLEDVRRWLEDPTPKPKSMSDGEWRSFLRLVGKFFLYEDRLYKKSNQSQHQLLVAKENRMYVMHSCHDALGHKGIFATTEMIKARFWWPGLEEDVKWYVDTCDICQKRKAEVFKIPPVITHTPSIFQVLHCDTMEMTPMSNGCKYILHGRCALSSWAEARAVRNQKTKQIARWLYEDIITRWCCLHTIVTDNAPQFKSVVAWLRRLYGIEGITISPYNSKANASIERPHFPLRESLAKAAAGELHKWFWYLPQVLWADRISIRKRKGVSPFFLVTGAHPTIPLDILEATWLVEPPNGLMSDEELVGWRARALMKHRKDVLAMREKVSREKAQRLLNFEREFEHRVQDWQIIIR
jgi:hypothetical protein